MVRRVLLAALLAALLALGSCAFFAVSLFPGYLSQAEAAVELGDQVDAFVDGRSNPLRGRMFVLRNAAGSEFPCLLLHLDYTPDRTLLVFDVNMNLIAQHTYAWLDWLRLLDANDNFVVGWLRFSDTAWSYLGHYNGFIDGSDVYRPGFSAGSDNFVLSSNWSSEMPYRKYNAAWGAPIDLSVTLGPGNYEPASVFLDTTRSDEEVILVLRANLDGRESVVVLRTPQDEYTSAFPTTQPLLGHYPYTTISRVDPNRVFYTQAGIAAADDDGRLTLYDFSGTEKSAIDLGGRKELWLAFDLAGAHFFCFSPEDRVLYKGNTGW